MRLLLGLLVSAGILVGLIRDALHADELYPSRSITLVVPVPPGGAADFIARSQRWGAIVRKNKIKID